MTGGPRRPAYRHPTAGYNDRPWRTSGKSLEEVLGSDLLASYPDTMEEQCGLSIRAASGEQRQRPMVGQGPSRAWVRASVRRSIPTEESARSRSGMAITSSASGS